jgi:hypothetical protein
VTGAASGERPRAGPVKRLARLVALVGALAVGWALFGRGSKDVVLVYDVAPDATSLEVALRRDGEIVRRAEFRRRGGEPLRHALRIPEGSYELDWRVVTPAGARAGERSLEVREAGTIVLPIGR